MSGQGFGPRDNGLMERTDAGPGLSSRWAGVGARLPSTLESLAGPGGGVVELPVDLAWSGTGAST